MRSNNSHRTLIVTRYFMLGSQKHRYRHRKDFLHRKKISFPGIYQRLCEQAFETDDGLNPNARVGRGLSDSASPYAILVNRYNT